tara:strand:+ start:110 stop:1813 length:1704 start_codon:yes stop_codon:yes gene_type:complete
MKKYNKGGRRLKVYAQETSKVPAEEQQFTAQDSTDVAFFRTLSDVIKQNPLNLSEGQSEEEIDKFKAMWEKSKSMGEIEGLSEEQLKEKFPSLYHTIKEYGAGYESPKGKFGSKKIDWSPIFKSGKYPLVGEGEEGVLDPEFNKGGRVYAQETSKVPKEGMGTGSQGYIEKFMEYLKGMDFDPKMLGTGGGKIEEKSDMMKKFLDYLYSKSGAETIGAKFNVPNIEGEGSDTTSTKTKGMKRTMTPLRPKELQDLIDKYKRDREIYEKELEQKEKEEYKKGGMVYAQETSKVPADFTKSDTTSVVEYRNLFDHLGQDPVNYIFQYENIKLMDEMNPGFLDMIMEQKNLHLDMGDVEGAPSKEDLEELKDPPPKKEYNMGGKTPKFMSNQSDMVGDFIYAQETSKVPTNPAVLEKEDWFGDKTLEEKRDLVQKYLDHKGSEMSENTRDMWRSMLNTIQNKLDQQTDEKLLTEIQTEEIQGDVDERFYSKPWGEVETKEDFEEYMKQQQGYAQATDSLRNENLRRLKGIKGLPAKEDAAWHRAIWSHGGGPGIVEEFKRQLKYGVKGRR